jgi:hypothetical protein
MTSVKISEHKGKGQLHTYSLGWPFVGRSCRMSMMSCCLRLCLTKLTASRKAGHS